MHKHQGNLPLYIVSDGDMSAALGLNESPERRMGLTSLILEVGGEKEQLLFENNRGATPLHVCVIRFMSDNIVKSLARCEALFDLVAENLQISSPE